MKMTDEQLIAATSVMDILDEEKDTSEVDYCLSVFSFILSGKKVDEETIKLAIAKLESIK